MKPAILALALTGCAALAPSAHRTPLDDAAAALRPDLVCAYDAVLVWTPAAVRVSPDLEVCVVYDPTQIKGIIRRYGYAAAVGIVAHELGHVVELRRESPETAFYGAISEPAADEWAGCALARQGLPIAPFQRFLKDNGEGSSERLNAIAQGFNRCHSSD